MKTIRIGNDITIQWTVRFEQEGRALSDYALTLLLKNRGTGSKIEIPASEYTLNGDTIAWTYRGAEQKKLGTYALELVGKDDNGGMFTIDSCQAFRLTATSNNCDNTSGDTCGAVEVETLRLTQSINAYPSYPTSSGANVVQFRIVIRYDKTYNDTEIIDRTKDYIALLPTRGDFKPDDRVRIYRYIKQTYKIKGDTPNDYKRFTQKGWIAPRDGIAKNNAPFVEYPLIAEEVYGGYIPQGLREDKTERFSEYGFDENKDAPFIRVFAGARTKRVYALMDSEYPQLTAAIKCGLAVVRDGKVISEIVPFSIIADATDMEITETTWRDLVKFGLEIR